MATLSFKWEEFLLKRTLTSVIEKKIKKHLERVGGGTYGETFILEEDSRLEGPLERIFTKLGILRGKRDLVLKFSRPCFGDEECKERFREFEEEGLRLFTVYSARIGTARIGIVPKFYGGFAVKDYRGLGFAVLIMAYGGIDLNKAIENFANYLDPPPVFVLGPGNIIRARIEEVKSKVVGISVGLFNALRKLHSEGLAHGDFKPGNVVVNLHIRFVNEEASATTRLPVGTILELDGGNKVKLVDIGSMCRFEDKGEEFDRVFPLCIKPQCTSMYCHMPLKMHVVGKKLEEGACLDMLHDWYGFIGTVYQLIVDTRLAKGRPWRKLVNFNPDLGLPTRDYAEIRGELIDFFTKRTGEDVPPTLRHPTHDPRDVFSSAPFLLDMIVKILHIDARPLLTGDAEPSAFSDVCDYISRLERDVEGTELSASPPDFTPEESKEDEVPFLPSAVLTDATNLSEVTDLTGV